MCLFSEKIWYVKLIKFLKIEIWEFKEYVILSVISNDRVYEKH